MRGYMNFNNSRAKTGKFQQKRENFSQGCGHRRAVCGSTCKLPSWRPQPLARLTTSLWTYVASMDPRHNCYTTLQAQVHRSAISTHENSCLSNSCFLRPSIAADRERWSLAPGQISWGVPMCQGEPMSWGVLIFEPSPWY